MGLGSSRNRMESEFQSDPDSNFISIRIDDSDEEAHSHRHVTGRATPIVPGPLPVPSTCETSDPDHVRVCPICLTNERDLAFGCGHLTCQDCGARLSNCPMCRQPIRNRIRLFTG